MNEQELSALLDEHAEIHEQMNEQQQIETQKRKCRRDKRRTYKSGKNA